MTKASFDARKNPKLSRLKEPLRENVGVTLSGFFLRINIPLPIKAKSVLRFVSTIAPCPSLLRDASREAP